MADASEPTVRAAGEADVPFLIEAIIEAEKSGTDLIPYCRIFSLGEPELRELLASILEEDFEGQELCISGFRIAEVDGEPAGAACAWIEGAEGLPSTLVKANLLQHFLDADRLAAAKPHFERLGQLTLPRAAGAIQLESIYVRPAFRGRGITSRILTEHLEKLRAKAPDCERAQIILVKGNGNAQRAYEKLGFRITQERHADDPELASIVPGDTKILMEKTL
ncbi:MAG: GNAT family N-acetyltransferase [Myxococcales bacterium]|nr:GNAT family N-acetyltransferase [Myxococcales bacterium]